MKNLGLAIGMAAATLFMVTPAFPQGDIHAGRGQAVVTVLPKHHSELSPNLTQRDLSVKVNGKESSVTGWLPLRGADDKLELVLLIDSAARDLGRQFDEIKAFIQTLPPHTRIAVGYMQNGSAVFSRPFSADHAEVLRALHLPNGSAGSSASANFYLSDLAKRWPSGDPGARREVVMVTDGREPYTERYDPDNTYVQAAIADSVRAGLVVYTIYWGRWNNPVNLPEGANSGQNYLAAVTQATGGKSYWFGTGNPVSFQPYFEDISLRLENQYRLSFAARLNGKPSVDSFKLKAGGMAADITAPQQVFVVRAGAVAQ